MKQHYIIQIQGDYQRLERKLDKYLERKTEARTELGIGDLITLKNGSTMILNKKEDHLEIIVATTDEYLQRAMNTLSKCVMPEQIEYRLI